MKFLLSFLFFFVLSLSTIAQSADKKVVNWLDFNELPAKLREERKPILVFIHTNWCKFCLMQQNTTFTDPQTVALLNREYYCLKLDAEHKEAIRFLNRDYQAQSGGYHQLAELLGKENGELTFPTTLLLSENLQLKRRQTGFINTENLRVLIQ